MTRYLKPLTFVVLLAGGTLLSMGQTRIVRGWNVVATPGLTLLTGATITFPFGSVLTDTASGTLKLTGTTPMFLFGGSSSGEPALKRNASGLDVKLADDSSFASVGALFVTATAGGGFMLGSNVKLIVATAPSAPSSCGTSPAVTSSNGSASFVVTGGTGGAATGCTITMPTATTGWNCNVVNITAAAAHRANVWTVQTASTTTSVTWEYQTVSTGAATAFTASDVFRGICFAY